MYLLDTNVVSELRRFRPHGAVVAWLRTIDEADLFLSAVTVGELQAGIEITRQRDLPKASEIEGWVDRIATSYNILSMDTATFRCRARLMQGRSGELTPDAMIAATADVHGLTIVTRNTKDFASFEIPLLNPFLSP